MGDKMPSVIEAGLGDRVKGALSRAAILRTEDVYLNASDVRQMLKLWQWAEEHWAPPVIISEPDNG